MIREKRILGRTGLDISLTGFGAWAIGSKSYGNVNETEAINIIKSYIQNGGNHIDTAEGYADSEKLIGRALKGLNVDNIIIASKTWNDGKKENISKVRTSLECSLKNLQRSHLDIYYMHFPPSNDEDMDRLFNEYEKLKKEGKIKYIGASIKGVDVTDDTVTLCEKYILDGRVDVIQLVYSVFRQKNEKIFNLARKQGIGIVARTSLESGFLTGKYKKGYIFDKDDHRSRWDKEKLDLILREVDNLNLFLEQVPYESLIQLAVKFAMQNEGIQSVIVGAKSKKQMMENCKIENLKNLTDEQVSYLKEKYENFTENCNTR